MLQNLNEPHSQHRRRASDDGGHVAGERRRRKTVRPGKGHKNFLSAVCQTLQNAEHLTNDMSLPYQMRKPKVLRG